VLLFLARRAAGAVVTLVGVLALVFLLVSAAPGDPAALAAHARTGTTFVGLSPEAVADFHRRYGLDRPAAVRFGIWLVRAASFDLGRSFQDDRPVAERIRDTLPATLLLNAGALLVALCIALPCGIAAARRPGGRLDRASALVFDLLFATPSFALGLALLLVFSARLRLLPLFADPRLGLKGVVLPVVTLALASVAPLERVVRASVLEALRTASALAARARGEGQIRQVLRALRRSGVPLVALGASIVPSAVSGSILVERLFSLPGSGGLMADAVFARDYPLILGLTLLVATLVILASFLSDAAAALLDPRLRGGGAGGPG